MEVITAILPLQVFPAFRRKADQEEYQVLWGWGVVQSARGKQESETFQAFGEQAAPAVGDSGFEISVQFKDRQSGPREQINICHG